MTARFWKRYGVVVFVVLVLLAPPGHSQRRLFERGVTDDWIPQPVTKTKFSVYVAQDQRRFVEENGLPSSYASRRYDISRRLANSIGDALEKQRVILDKESLGDFLEIVSRASGRAIYDTDDVKIQQTNAVLVQLVQEAAKTAAPSNGFRYITRIDIQGALLRICPVYPIC